MTEFNREVSEEIKAHISFETLCSRYSINTEKSQRMGRELAFRCPLPGHDDKKPSFSMNTASLRYKCHGCGRTGDVFNFIAEMEELSIKSNFPEILERAAQIAGIPLDKDGTVERKSYEEIRVKIQEKIECDDPLKNAAAEAYLERKGLDIRTLTLDWGAENDREAGADIVVPMCSPDLKGIRIGAQRGRKKMMPGSHVGLFYDSAHITGRGGEVFVVEGLSDYLSMLAAGYDNTIGMASATMRVEDVATALEGYEIVNICLDLDRHKAGDDNRGNLTGAKKMVTLAGKIDKKKSHVKLYELGGEHKFDLNDLWQGGGAGAISDFFAEHVKNINEMSTEVGMSANPDAYNCAKIFISRFNVAVDMGVRHQWLCDPATNVWRQAKKNEVEDMVRLLIESVRSTGHTTKMINETVRYISMMTSESIKKLDEKISAGDLVDVNPDDLDGSVTLCLKDGLYHPFSGDFRPYVASDYVYSTLAVSHSDIKSYTNKTLEKSRFMGFLKEVLAGEDDMEDRIAFIQEWFGYILLPTNIFEKFLVIQGGGGNGKSTLLECIGEIVGDGNFTNMELTELTSSRFASSHLLGAYVNLCAEGDRANVFDTPELKKITGGDLLTAEKKFSDPFQFRPFCKIVVATNPDPTVSEDADWLARRMQMIRFKNTFRGKEDFFLKTHLKNEKDMIFWWAVQGMKRLLRNQNFTDAPSVRKTTEDILRSADMITPFCKYLEKINSNTGIRSIESVNHVYKEFTVYMMEFEGRSRRFIPAKRRFVKDMTNNGYRLHEVKGEAMLTKEDAPIDPDNFEFD